MEKYTIIIFLISTLLVASIYASSESSESTEVDGKESGEKKEDGKESGEKKEDGKESHGKKENGKEVSMYQDLYCQTEFVMKEKLIEVPEGSENAYKIFAGDNVDQLDCQPIIEKAKQKFLKEFKKKHKSLHKGKDDKEKSDECSMKKFEELGYEKLRFKTNALLGLDLPVARKNELRSQINKEIAELIEKSVEECSLDIEKVTTASDIKGEIVTESTNAPNVAKIDDSII